MSSVTSITYVFWFRVQCVLSLPLQDPYLARTVPTHRVVSRIRVTRSNTRINGMGH